MLPRFSRYGGVEQFGCRLAEALAAKGYSVDFICARQEVDAPANVTVRKTGRPFGPRWLKMLVFAKKAEAIRRANEYDCVISLGKTLHQDILRVGGGPLPEFWKLSERSYPAGTARCLKKLQRRLNPANILTRRIENEQYRTAKRIVAVSHFVRDLILSANPETDRDRMRVIYNKPDLTRFAAPSPEERKNARHAFGIAPETIAIGLATSNFQLKGTAPLIKALTKLPENCALVVAGGRNHAPYMKLAQELGLGDRVRFCGKVDDMPAWYKAIDVFTLPSFYDACSNAVLEALASGLPTLSSASNGSSYFLPPENVVANPGDANELAHVLTRLVKEAARNTASGTRETFVWPENIASGITAFVSLVEEYLAKKS
ncbi:MAG: Lipopolysaccharide core biosynthesis protein RfaG [Desulfovibrio sp.]